MTAKRATARRAAPTPAWAIGLHRVKPPVLHFVPRTDPKEGPPPLCTLRVQPANKVFDAEELAARLEAYAARAAARLPLFG